MNKNHLYLLLDTETANTIDCPICYNVAWAIIDGHGNVYSSGNYINRDVFYGMPDLMASAYYANKIPEYEAQIASGEIIVASWYEIREAFRAMCELFNVKAIIAHNMRFDYRSCTTTQRYETASKYRYFFPKGVELWDTVKMAQDVILTKASYRRFCEENGYICKNGQLRKTAEILYRYISKNEDFEEEHKAMEDVDIECQIFWYCLRQHKKMRRNCFGEG